MKAKEYYPALFSLIAAILGIYTDASAFRESLVSSEKGATMKYELVLIKSTDWEIKKVNIQNFKEVTIVRPDRLIRLSSRCSQAVWTVAPVRAT